MASPVGVKFKLFWESVLQTAQQKQRQYHKISGNAVADAQQNNILRLSGPRVLDTVYNSMNFQQKQIVHKLSCRMFQLPTHENPGAYMNAECKERLSAENANRVNGIHWGTWS